MSKKVTYTEIFNSVQGEGLRTGRLCSWVRFFSCNLSCDGFGQSDPTDRSSYVLPYQTINIQGITKIQDLPLFEQGCDTSHSWSAKYKHLAIKDTASNVAAAVKDLLVGKSFTHPNGTGIEHVFTGGEPMLQQLGMIDIVDAWIAEDDYPKIITIETNGTQPLRDDFKQKMADWWERYGIKVMFSVSPKLFNVSGESADRAIKPDIISQYFQAASSIYQDNEFGQLKFVVNDKSACWAELNDVVTQLRTKNVTWPVMVMPVGASYDAQTNSSTIGAIADMAIMAGYHVTGRLHVVLWGDDQHGR